MTSQHKKSPPPPQTVLTVSNRYFALYVDLCRHDYMSNMTDILKETVTACPSQAPVFFMSTCVLHEHLCSPRFGFFGGVRVQPIFLVFYVVFLVLFVFFCVCENKQS
jgi:hypothetical protein